MIPRKKFGRICRIFERRRAPLSDHLFDYFSASSSAFLGLKNNIKEAYLLSEILPALAYLDRFELSDLEAKLVDENGLRQNYVWAPVAGKDGLGSLVNEADF